MGWNFGSVANSLAEQEERQHTPQHQGSEDEEIKKLIKADELKYKVDNAI